MAREVLLFEARGWCILGLMNLWIPFLCLVVTPPNHHFLPPCKQATDNFVGKQQVKSWLKGWYDQRRGTGRDYRAKGSGSQTSRGQAGKLQVESWTDVILDYTAPATQPQQTVQAEIHAQCASTFEFLGYGGHLELYVKCLIFNC